MQAQAGESLNFTNPTFRLQKYIFRRPAARVDLWQQNASESCGGSHSTKAFSRIKPVALLNCPLLRQIERETGMKESDWLTQSCPRAFRA